MVKGTFWVGRVRRGKGVGASAAGLQKVGPPMKNDMWNVKISFLTFFSKIGLRTISPAVNWESSEIKKKGKKLNI